jgi:hypothetical protein
MTVRSFLVQESSLAFNRQRLGDVFLPEDAGVALREVLRSLNFGVALVDLFVMQDIFGRCELWMAQGPGPFPGQFAADLKLREYYYQILVYLNGKRYATATVIHNGMDRVVPQGEKDRGCIWDVARDVMRAYIKVLFYIPAK